MEGTIECLVILVSDGSIELINKVDSFYQSAWSMLIITGSIFLGVVGIIVPYAIQMYQNKNLKLSEEALKKTISDHMLKQEVKLTTSIDEKLKLLSDKIDEEINKSSALATARTFHIQGNQSLKENSYIQAASDYHTAALNYSIANDSINLATVLDLVYDSLDKLNHEEIEELKVQGFDFIELINSVDKIFSDGTFQRATSKLKIILHKKERDKNKAPISQ